MRQIEKMMVQALNQNREMHVSNTSVENSFGVAMLVFLHGNCIASKDLKTGKIAYSCGGWHSRTTASRLRALGCDCYMKGGRIIDRATGREVLYYFGAKS